VSCAGPRRGPHRAARSQYPLRHRSPAERHDRSLIQTPAADNAARLSGAVRGSSHYDAMDRPVWFRCGSWDEIVSMAVQVCLGYQKKGGRGNRPWRKRRFRFELV